jgi:hypothetical protein
MQTSESLASAILSKEATPRPIYSIAREVYATWPKINYAAKPYLEAMQSLRSVKDAYGYDSGIIVVRYFLANATSWRGADARRIKAELNAIIKAAQ